MQKIDLRPVFNKEPNKLLPLSTRHNLSIRRTGEMDEVTIDFKAKRGYFEKQNDKDCLVHSFNNAFGRQVLQKQQVLDYIYQRAEVIYEKWCKKRTPHAKIDEKMDAFFHSVMHDKNTFFTAQVVWKAAQKLGIINRIIRIPELSNSRYLEGSIPDWATKKPIVILGESPYGFNHAIAVRDMMIYDSEMKNPLPWSLENLAKCLKTVHGGYAFD